MGSSLQDLSVGKDFLKNTPFTQRLRPTTDKCELRKLKSFCTYRDAISLLQRKLREWEVIITRYISDRRLLSRLCRALTKQRTEKTNGSIKKWSMDLNREFSKEIIKKGYRIHQKLFTILGN